MHNPNEVLGTKEVTKSDDPVQMIKKLHDLLVMEPPAGQPIFKRELAGYAAVSAAKELVDNWTDALPSLHASGTAASLLGDVGYVIQMLYKFRAHAQEILLSKYVNPGLIPRIGAPRAIVKEDLCAGCALRARKKR